MVRVPTSGSLATERNDADIAVGDAAAGIAGGAEVGHLVAALLSVFVDISVLVLDGFESSVLSLGLVCFCGFGTCRDLIFLIDLADFPIDFSDTDIRVLVDLLDFVVLLDFGSTESWLDPRTRL